MCIIGSAKAGTSSLFRHLGRHPGVVAGHHKEPRFFTRWSERTWSGPGSGGFQRFLIQDNASYLANFNGLAPDQWALDGSTDYLWCPESLDMLAEFGEYSDVRLICVVRDPVDRAVSEYNHTLRSNLETLSFAQSLEAEEGRMSMGWQPFFYHKRRSMVSEDIRRYADRFGDRLLVIDYADLRDEIGLMRRVWQFLGIEEVSSERMARQNESFIPRNSAAGAILRSKRVRRLGGSLLPKQMRKFIWDKLHANARDVVTVKPEERAYLRAELAEEIGACVADPLIPTDNWTCRGH